MSAAAPEAVVCILRALASDGVFAEGEPRVFRNMDFWSWLREHAPERELFDRATGHGVLLEAVLEGGDDPDGSKWLDLLMLALVGGRERDEAQWRALLAANGLEAVRVEDGMIEATCR